MQSREVICFSCKHQFRANIIDDDSFYVRSKDGNEIKVDGIDQCPECRELMYLSHTSLIGLDTDKYDQIGGYRLS